MYYIKNHNATQSAIKAGFSPRTASQIGYQLLQKSSVRKEIEKLKEMKRQSILIDEEDIVEMHMRIAFADITDFLEFGQEEVPIIDEEGNSVATRVQNVVNFKDSDVVDGQLIKEVKQGRQGVSIKLEDRMKALEWLANYFNMNPDSRHKKEYDLARLKLQQEELAFKKEIESRKNW